MRLRTRALLTLAGLFLGQFLLWGYFDYRAKQEQLLQGLQRQVESARLFMAHSGESAVGLPQLLAGTPLAKDAAVELLTQDLSSTAGPVDAQNPDRISLVESPVGDYYHYLAHWPPLAGIGEETRSAVLSIRIPARKLRAVSFDLFRRDLPQQLIAILPLFLLAGWLFERMLLAPVGRLSRVASSLMEGVPADFAGELDLDQVSQGFERLDQGVKQREQALRRQKGLYAVLSHTNKIIIRDVEPRELFDRFCEIAVSQGGFSAAWIGETDPRGQSIRPVASSDLDRREGADSAISLMQDSPLKTAILGRCGVIVEQIDWGHANLEWCRPIPARGGESAAVLPILSDGGVFGALCVYAASPGYFDETVNALLDEVAGDIAFAIENRARNKAHRAAHRELAQSSERLGKLNQQMKLLLESTGEGIFGVDLKGYCTFINQAAASMLGYRQEQLLQQPIHRLIRVQELAHNAFSQGMDRKRAPRRIKDESFRRLDETQFPVEYSTHPMIQEERLMGAVTVFRDVTETRSMMREMRFLASHDPLTHLYNRHAFDQRLRQAFAEAKDYNLTHVLFYMDLDQFKLVNDTCGHVAGDTMLRHLAHHLRQAIGAGGVLARLGGDEFGLLLERSDLNQGLKVAQRIFESVGRFRFSWEGRSFSCGVSIGIAEINGETESTPAAMSAADTACYVAKDMGRNRVHVYRPYDEEISRQQGQVRWVNRIESAIEQDRFSLQQQPILSIGRHDIGEEHVEVLLRMRGDDGSEIKPGAFIPAAERYNLMGSLDRWVIRNTFSWLAEHPRQLDELGLCAINLSGQSLMDGSLYEYILEQLRTYGLPAEKISFEVTETAVVSRLDQAARFISLLKRRGFRFALDDFGTGMSSFGYLKSLPVDFLKIDGSFVKNMLNDPVDRAMVESINRVGHLMGLRTIAEYVESDQVLEQLIDLGVDYAQGFGILRPAPLSAMGSGVGGAGLI